MKLVWSARRALPALAVLATLSAAPAFAYDDKSTVSSVMELVGVSTDPSASKIDYSERPKLVLPPRVGELPAPAEGAERPAGWPADTGAARRRNSDRFAKVSNAPPEEKKPGLLERVRGPKSDAAPGTDDEPGLLQKIMNTRARANAPSTEEPARRMLTEPPAGYRQPTMDLSKVPDTDVKKSSWWNPLSYVGGGGSDSDPVAKPGAPTPAQQQAKSSDDGGLLSRMTPSFLKGSDK